MTEQIKGDSDKALYDLICIMAKAAMISPIISEAPAPTPATVLPFVGVQQAPLTSGGDS